MSSPSRSSRPKRPKCWVDRPNPSGSQMSCREASVSVLVRLAESETERQCRSRRQRRWARRERKEPGMNVTSSARSRPLTREQHIGLGKTARRRVPRELQADWSVSARTSDPLTLLLGQETTRACLSWYRSDTAAWRGRRLPFTGEPPYRWPQTCPPCRTLDSMSSCAATRTWRTSVASPRPSVIWSSTSMISTKPPSARSSGM